jgi:hypothetical protein
MPAPFRLVVVLSSGAALSCSPLDPTPTPPLPGNPPIPEATPSPVPPTNPPVATPAPLPTWDQVESGHPKGATNPPIPELIVTPDRHCYKNWRPSMIMPSGPSGNRVQTCPTETPNPCGTEIQCPPEAQGLLDAWFASQPTQNPPAQKP